MSCALKPDGGLYVCPRCGCQEHDGPCTGSRCSDPPRRPAEASCFDLFGSSTRPCCGYCEEAQRR